MVMKRSVTLIVSFVVLLVVGVIVWKLQHNSVIQSINSYDECTKANYPILETYPEQCRTPDGRSFTKQVKVQPDIKQETVEEIGLSLQHPTNLMYRKEIADDVGKIRTAGFFLTKGDENNPEYQMYGLYEAYKDATKNDLEKLKTEMDPKTIKETSLDGYKGIEGLIVGPKTRYVTIILKDNKLFSVSTMPPTLENKAITDQVLPTLHFN